MKQTVNFYDFEQAFRAHNRYESFGHEGLRVLFDWLESYEEDCGTELEVDVIALCCDYSHGTIEEIAQDYGLSIEGMEADEARDLVREFLENNTILLDDTEEGFVYCSAF